MASDWEAMQGRTSTQLGEDNGGNSKDKLREKEKTVHRRGQKAEHKRMHTQLALHPRSAQNESCFDAHMISEHFADADGQQWFHAQVCIPNGFGSVGSVVDGTKRRQVDGGQV